MQLHVNRHLKAHDKRAAELTFTCKTCGESFRSPRSFQRGSDRPFNCTTRKHTTLVYNKIDTEKRRDA